MRFLLSLLLFLALLLCLAQTEQVKVVPKISSRNTTLTNTECNQCKKVDPPISKCTNCEAPIRAKGAMASRCDGTLTCEPGRILIANNRYVVTQVRCSEDSSVDEEVWIGKTSSNEEILVESAACFIKPISCISLGSFSTRCPQGYDCDPVLVLEEKLSCPSKSWESWVYLNLYHKHLWFRGSNKEWQRLAGDLACDPQLGTWVETIRVKHDEKLRSIITERIICGKKEFKLFGMTIELKLAKVAVTAVQICLPIFLIAMICIFKQWRKRAYLKNMKSLLDGRRAEGKAKLRAIKEADAHKVRTLIDRWRQVNKFVVEKNKPHVAAYKKQKKNK